MHFDNWTNVKRSSVVFHCKVSFSSFLLRICCLLNPKVRQFQLSYKRKSRRKSIACPSWQYEQQQQKNQRQKEMERRTERERKVYVHKDNTKKIAFCCHFVTPCWLLSARILCFCRQHLYCVLFALCIHSNKYIELQSVVNRFGAFYTQFK